LAKAGFLQKAFPACYDYALPYIMHNINQVGFLFSKASFLVTFQLACGNYFGLLTFLVLFCLFVCLSPYERKLDPQTSRSDPLV